MNLDDHVRKYFSQVPTRLELQHFDLRIRLLLEQAYLAGYRQGEQDVLDKQGRKSMEEKALMR